MTTDKIKTPQKQPLLFKNSRSELSAAIFVDEVKLDGRNVSVTGWATQNCVFELMNNTAVLQTITRHDRPDVAKVLKTLEGGVGLGFHIATRIPSIRELNLTLRLAFGVSTVSESNAVKTYPLEVSGAKQTSKPMVHAAHIESATHFSNANQLIVAGWLLAENESDIWIQTETGHFVSLDQCYRYSRTDIYNAYHERVGLPAQRAGFIARIAQSANSRKVRIMFAEKDEDKVVAESEIVYSNAGKTDSITQLVHIRTPANDWNNRIPLIDLPFLRAIETKAAAIRSEFIPNNPQENPLEATYVIWVDAENVPLENLAVALSKDASFRRTGELIFVFENEGLERFFNAKLAMFSRLYGLNIKSDVVVISRNIVEGFNQAARQSKGKVLFFSSAHEIPMSEALTSKVCKMHVDRTGSAVIAPLILNYSGTVESAGMRLPSQPDRFLIRGFSTVGSGVDPKLLPGDDADGIHSAPFEFFSIKREAYYSLSGFSNQFISFEFSVIDFCKRVQEIGRVIEVNRDLSVVSLRSSRSVAAHDEDTVFRRSTLELSLLLGLEAQMVNGDGV